MEAAAAAASANDGVVVASSADTPLAAKQADPWAYSTAMKTEFQELLAEFVQQLSVQHFEPILNKLPSTVYGTDYVSDIRAELLHKLHESHDYFWQSKYVDENLQCLHDVVSRSSRQAAGSSDAKAAAWRPTGKTPAEQVSMERTSLICAKLKLMKKLMAKQLAEQQQMVAELESYRGRMEMIQAKRLLLGAQMEMRHAELQTADERLRELSEMLAGMADSSSDSP